MALLKLSLITIVFSYLSLGSVVAEARKGFRVFTTSSGAKMYSELRRTKLAWDIDKYTCEAATKKFYGVNGDICHVMRRSVRYGYKSMNVYKTCVRKGNCNKPPVKAVQRRIHCPPDIGGCRYSVGVAIGREETWALSVEGAFQPVEILSVSHEQTFKWSKGYEETRRFDVNFECGSTLVVNVDEHGKESHWIDHGNPNSCKRERYTSKNVCKYKGAVIGGGKGLDIYKVIAPAKARPRNDGRIKDPSETRSGEREAIDLGKRLAKSLGKINSQGNEIWQICQVKVYKIRKEYNIDVIATPLEKKTVFSATPYKCGNSGSIKLSNGEYYLLKGRIKTTTLADYNNLLAAEERFSQEKNASYLKPLGNPVNHTGCHVEVRYHKNIGKYRVSRSLMDVSRGAGNNPVTIKPQAKQSLCLEANGNIKSESRVRLSNCNNSNRQKWRRDAKGRYQNAHNPAFCLNMTYGSISPRNWVRINRCQDSWAYKYNAHSKEFKPHNKGWGGQCIDVKNSNFSHNAAVWVYKCNKGKAQKWVIK